MTTEDRLKEIEEKLDKVLDLAPTIEALGRILIRRRTATDRAELHRSTIDSNTKINKFKEFGHERTFIEIGEVAVIQKRKKPARSRSNSKKV